MRTDGTEATHDDAHATAQDGTYPRPQMTRRMWADLCGPWNFCFDDQDAGLSARWYRDPRFSASIIVPFPPESPASTIHDTSHHTVAWYHRDLDLSDLTRAGYGTSGDRLLLHFGAVDYRCRVWLNGSLLGEHEGGHTPFSFDVTDALEPSLGVQSLVVRVEDDPLDVSKPRGKQDWQTDPHSIWYHRTTGIWQPVWLEAVPDVFIESLHWVPDVPASCVTVAVRLSARPPCNTSVIISLSYEGVEVGAASFPVTADRLDAVVHLPAQRNGQAYEEMLWSPEHPRLLDAVVALRAGDEAPVLRDTVHSYVGLRSAAVDRGAFLLNDRPYYVRSVLSQGYWPQSHLASPSAEALRAEVQLIKDLGFNAARVHQKIEDPRFLFWADRLGLLVWGEMPGAYEFTATAVTRMVAEWTQMIDRDLSHPCVVTWVPLNESWGVQHIAHDRAMRDYARMLFHLTKTLDQSRPVISNDGWEHLDSDIWSVHDYEWSASVVRERYADDGAKGRLFSGMGPAGRRIRLSAEPDRGQPVMLTEFGGVQLTPGAHAAETRDTWGYSQAQDPADFAARVEALVEAVLASDFLAGFCYTQLTDTLQEANGLCDENRVPKLPIEVIARIVRGGDSGSGES